jgi:hypothetical protein
MFSVTLGHGLICLDSPTSVGLAMRQTTFVASSDAWRGVAHALSGVLLCVQPARLL